MESCRDPDDNKFLNGAKDSHALYIVSGDKDLLVIEQFGNIQIVNGKDFCEKYFFRIKKIHYLSDLLKAQIKNRILNNKGYDYIET